MADNTNTQEGEESTTGTRSWDEDPKQK